MRYFYDIRSGDEVVRDEEGSEHPDLAAAEAEAIEAAREIMAEAILKGQDVSGRVLEITDERRLVITRVSFGAAVTPAANCLL